MAGSVLLITHSEDGPAELVADAIRARGFSAVRFDTDRFPTELLLEIRQGPGSSPETLLREGSAAVDLSSIASVWYRRFYSAKLPTSLEAEHARYSRLEARTLLSALFASLHRARWIDPIERVHRAHHKLLQLEVAKQAGFAVPDTLSTNDPAAALRFYEAHDGRVVTKMLNSISMTEDGREQMVFTSEVTRESLREIDGLRLCPAVFQEMVPKEVELRIAVVRERLFVASIDLSGRLELGVDWRRDQNLARSFRPATVPESVRRSVLEVMAFYGLTYASFDVIRRPDGEHVFLEINSAGEWGWLCQSVGLPIPEALAEALTREL